MTPIQQLMLGVGAKKKTYMDDVFSTYLWKGTGSARSINNGIDLAGEGGMVWTKMRDNNLGQGIFDTERGTNKAIFSYQSNANYSTTTDITSFNSNGFSLGTSNTWFTNRNTNAYTSWTFRKSPGFFDVVKFTGNGSNRTIAHSLGCVPGLIMIKNVSAGENWRVYHRATKATHSLELNDTDIAGASSTPFNNTEPTASVFSVGTDGATNNNGDTIVAYLFANGKSSAATARSVDFDGNNDALYVPDNSAWDVGGVDFTMECWVNFKSHNGHDGIFHNVGNSGWNGGGWIMEPVGGVFYFYYTNTGGSTGNVSGAKIPLGQWQHIAVTKSGSTIKIYQDGILTGSGTINGTIRDGTNSLKIGGQCVGEDCDASISNVRITIGQILYTSSFKPSTVPLTTTSQGATLAAGM